MTVFIVVVFLPWTPYSVAFDGVGDHYCFSFGAGRLVDWQDFRGFSRLRRRSHKEGRDERPKVDLYD